MTRRKRYSRKVSPKGRYVYAWFNDESPFPFYVGKGVGDRAWKRHMLRGQTAICNKIRSTSKRFWIHIVRDGLTNEGAMLLEAALVDMFSALGGCVANQVCPMRRQEVPPLWLEEVLKVHLESVDALQPEDCDEDGLLSEIISVLDKTEGRGCICLTPGKISEHLDFRYGRERIVNCMKRHGLNP
jgi:hypothetical protein